MHCRTCQTATGRCSVCAYSRDLTQQQVSRIVGVSQVQVSRIEKTRHREAEEMLREKGVLVRELLFRVYAKLRIENG